jgi:GNAT superfamily N-acetyltransferase
VAKAIIRPFRKTDLLSIKKLIHDLHPEWFTEDALKNIPRDIQLARCLVAEAGGRIVGFVSFHSEDGMPMLSWLATDRSRRGTGVGRLLVDAAVDELQALGYRDVRVRTVGECEPIYPPYAETLSFYKSMDFEIEKKGRLRQDLGYRWRYATLRKRLD